jgi:uncharacterized membrane protein YjjB (DUF3815 family)
MDLSAMLMNGLWAGLFAAGLAVMLTAPPRYILAAFACGFFGRGLRDVCTGLDLTLNWATVIAATAVVLVAVAFTRRHTVSPVVLICGVLPLGATGPIFNVIFNLMRISTAKGDPLSETTLALGSNAGKAFVITLAIALGLGAGMAIVRLFGRETEVG